MFRPVLPTIYETEIVSRNECPTRWESGLKRPPTPFEIGSEGFRLVSSSHSLRSPKRHVSFKVTSPIRVYICKK